jgi:ribosomal protein L15
LHDYKILAKGDVKDKFLIKAKSASSQAQEKVKKAGGKIIAAEQQSAEQK